MLVDCKHPLGELATQLPAETASDLAQKAGMSVSCAELDRLARDLGKACSDETRALLLKQALAQLEPAKPEGEGRMMVLQMDGCFVFGQAQDGKCPGIELNDHRLEAGGLKLTTESRDTGGPPTRHS